MVSIIIPIYNVEKYIEQCLNSVLLQTYKDIQVIIVDDGSTDNSTKIVRKVVKDDKRIVFLNQKNKGVSEARNYALKFVKGEYILFIDSDDYLEKEAIEEMVNKMETTESDIIICGYNKFYDLNTKQDLKVLYDKNENEFYTNKDIAEMMLENKMEGYLWNKLFRTKIWKSLNLSFDSGRYVQDWFPVFKYIVNSNKIRFIQKPLYNYRQREGSAVNKKRDKFLNDYCYAVRKILNYIDNSNLLFDNSIVDYFKYYTYIQAIQYYISLNAKEGFNIYKLYDDRIYLQINDPLKKVMKNKYLSKKNKFIFLLWKMKILHILKSIKGYK